MTPTALTAPAAPGPLRKAKAMDLHRIDDRHRFRMLQIAHGGSVLIIDDSGTIRHAGASVQASHSRPLVGEPVLSLLHHQDMLNTVVVLDRARAEREESISCVTRLRIGGQWEWFRATATRFGYTATEGHAPERVTAFFVAPLHSAQSVRNHPTHITAARRP